MLWLIKSNIIINMVIWIFDQQKQSFWWVFLSSESCTINVLFNCHPAQYRLVGPLGFSWCKALRFFKKIHLLEILLLYSKAYFILFWWLSLKSNYYIYSLASWVVLLLKDFIGLTFTSLFLLLITPISQIKANLFLLKLDLGWR